VISLSPGGQEHERAGSSGRPTWAIDQFDVLAALAGLELVLLELGHPLATGCGLASVQQVLAAATRQPAMV
jgi:hypothetical protein